MSEDKKFRIGISIAIISIFYTILGATGTRLSWMLEH